MIEVKCRFCRYVETQEEDDSYRCSKCGAYQDVRNKQKPDIKMGQVLTILIYSIVEDKDPVVF